ncbi:geranylgeranyl transferase type-2 subunit beta-like protein [Euroglyphus maynei]|uniref:Geranylgeranyl transferase type-2 subunit beta n=1 Tax=Euroglyphus maynei TaxID=6958 RepID=A0A1Y3ANK0_EURMA|nr:geranylgeranyl transferase type-2 subunit beta-like protein [Euroglyphus maynei]
MLLRDIELKDDSPKEFFLDKHVKFLNNYAKNKDNSYEQIMVEYLKMNGIYWTITALKLADSSIENDIRQEIIELIRSCKHPNGGISAAPRHDPHILYTLSAIQILVSFDVNLESSNPEESVIDVNKTVEFIMSLQNDDGSFNGDHWGEVDVRFTFCSIASLALLKRLDAIDLDRAIDFVMKCYNQIDGAFGCRPNSESHSGLTYCCLGSLSIAGQLHRIDADRLGWWLAERQLPSGGLNGRPEKLPDLCYSWWVLSSLAIIGRLHWINKQKLLCFIMACQDNETGGFSDRPGNMVDPFHTLFGITGLSLLSHEYFDDSTIDHKQNDQDDRIDIEKLRKIIQKVNPVFCMLDQTITKMGIRIQRLSII